MVDGEGGKGSRVGVVEKTTTNDGKERMAWSRIRCIRDQDLTGFKNLSGL